MFQIRITADSWPALEAEVLKAADELRARHTPKGEAKPAEEPEQKKAPATRKKKVAKKKEGNGKAEPSLEQLRAQASQLVRDKIAELNSTQPVKEVLQRWAPEDTRVSAIPVEHLPAAIAELEALER